MGARRLAAWTAAALLALPPAAAAAGAPPDAPDPAFAGGGVTTATLAGASGPGAGALLLDHAGRPVVVSGAGGSAVGLMRFLGDGRPDAGFGGPQPGAAVTDVGGASGFSALAEQAGGALVAGGFVQRAGDVARFALVRWTPSGAPDRTVVDVLPGEIAGLAVQADGRIVAAGRSGGRIGLARYAADGGLDPSFASGGHQQADFGAATQEDAADVALDAGGRILVAGTATVGGTRRLALARYTAGGAVDDTFDLDGIRFYDPGQALAMARQPDGRVLVAGTSGGDAVVLRVLADGTPDPAFGTAGLVRLGVPGGVATGVALQPDGKVVLAGSAEGVDSFLARLRPGGRADPGFGVRGVVRRSLGTAGRDGLSGVRVAPDGGLVAAGSAGDAILLARLVGGDSSDPAMGMTAAASGDLVRFTMTASNPGADAAQGVTVAVTPPAGVRAIGLVSGGGRCAGRVCAVGTVAAGGFARVTLLARARRPGRLTARATVASPTFDANPGDNAAAATGRATTLRRPDRTKPRVRLAVRPRRLRDVRHRVRLAVRCSEAARVRITVRAGRTTLAKGKLRFTRKRSRAVPLKLTKAGRKVVRRKSLRRLRLVVRARATDRAGNRATKTLRKTLRR
jgi:uncharacterized delta-60 repeat protein/uncharacterized repeat protein (TIGR01451 family)